MQDIKKVASCELQKTVYSIKYRVSSEEKIKMVSSCKVQVTSLFSLPVYQSSGHPV